MSQMTVDQALQLALEHQRANQLAEAEEIFRQILDAFPDQADALHLLGALYFQAKRPDLAEARVRQAIAVRREPAFFLTLGVILQESRRYEEALAVYRELLAEKPGYEEGLMHQGVVLGILGRFEESLAAFETVLRQSPGHVQAQGNMGIALCHLQRYDEAIWVLRAALARAPESADFHASLGAALYGSGQFDAALEECRKGARLDPGHVQAHNLMAVILRLLGRVREAVDPAQKAAALQPQFVDVQVTYGETLRQAGMLDEARDHYLQTIGRLPPHGDLHNNLGNVYKDQGCMDEAIAEYRKSLALGPSPRVMSNLIYTVLYHPDYSPQEAYREIQRYEETFAAPLRSAIQPHRNRRDPARRLRIAYLSPEFRQHALGLNLIPLISRHDRSQFEIFCYAGVENPDFYTFRFRQLADRWVDVRGKSDEQIAEQIRRDQVDILLDLHQHMAGNRLGVCARQPAPVQIAFAGYPGTSGLHTVAYRLTDPYLEPPGEPPPPGSEEPMWLPHSFWCYHPAIDIPVNELPALSCGYVTFGNLNNFCKINAPMMELWARIMKAVAHSRLLLLAPEGSARDRTRAFFEHRGIHGSRIDFSTRLPAPEYYRLYHQVDLGLDSYPCNGHTTGLDSFWMGVPVTSFIGDCPFGRATWSQVSNLNMRELVAPTREGFVEKSIALASDLTRLAEYRRSLRERMRQSPLMDDAGFARGVESAYREAWRRWCAQGD